MQVRATGMSIYVTSSECVSAIEYEGVEPISPKRFPKHLGFHPYNNVSEKRHHIYEC